MRPLGISPPSHCNQLNPPSPSPNDSDRFQVALWLRAELRQIVLDTMHACAQWMCGREIERKREREDSGRLAILSTFPFFFFFLRGFYFFFLFIYSLTLCIPYLHQQEKAGICLLIYDALDGGITYIRAFEATKTITQTIQGRQRQQSPPGKRKDRSNYPNKHRLSLQYSNFFTFLPKAFLHKPSPPIPFYALLSFQEIAGTGGRERPVFRWTVICPAVESTVKSRKDRWTMGTITAWAIIIRSSGRTSRRLLVRRIKIK